MPSGLRLFFPLLVLAAFFSAPPVVRAMPIPADQVALGPGEYRWLSEGPWAGPLYMIISIEKQMVHVYDGDRLIGAASVSTGMKGHRTPTGEFPILQKRQWHRSNIYSNAPMPFMQRLTWDGIALHAGHNPGYPASHGCIRLPYGFASKLFGLTRIGTPVSVTTDQLSPVLMVGTLVLADPDDPASAIVTFTPPDVEALSERTVLSQQSAQLQEQQDVPMLKVDPAIFRFRTRR